MNYIFIFLRLFPLKTIAQYFYFQKLSKKWGFLFKKALYTDSHLVFLFQVCLMSN